MVDNTNQKNLLSADVHIKGELMFAGELLFDGKLEGAIRTEGNLMIGENAQLQGDAHVGNVMVRGKVTGNINAANRVDLRGKAELSGDITAARLVMDETVTFCGKLDVNPTRAPASSPTVVRQVAPTPAAAGQPRPVEPGALEGARAAAAAASVNGNGNGLGNGQPSPQRLVTAGAR